MMRRHTLLNLAPLLLVLFFTACGDGKLRARIAALDDETLNEIQVNYSAGSNERRLIDAELERRKAIVTEHSVPTYSSTTEKVKIDDESPPPDIAPTPEAPPPLRSVAPSIFQEQTLKALAAAQAEHIYASKTIKGPGYMDYWEIATKSATHNDVQIMLKRSKPGFGTPFSSTTELTFNSAEIPQIKALFEEFIRLSAKAKANDVSTVTIPVECIFADVSFTYSKNGGASLKLSQIENGIKIESSSSNSGVWRRGSAISVNLSDVEHFLNLFPELPAAAQESIERYEKKIRDRKAMMD